MDRRQWVDIGSLDAKTGRPPTEAEKRQARRDKREHEPWRGMELGRMWLSMYGEVEARNAVKYFLRRVLRPDGTARMTERDGSQLAVEFCEMLTHSEAFTRPGVLTPVQIDLGILRWAKGMSMRQIARVTKLSRGKIEKELAHAVDRLLGIVFQD